MKWGFPTLLPWLLLAIPAGWALWIGVKQYGRKLERLTAREHWPHMLSAYRPQSYGRRTALWALACFLLLIALARPQWGFRWREVKTRGLDIMVVLDTSRSMLAEDIKPHRLQQAKWGIQDLVRQLRGDRIGLVPFAGGSILQCPLTADYNAFNLTLQDIYVGIIPHGGTDIAQALHTAIDGFDDESKADRVILLITDGEAHEGDLDRTAERLKREDIKLFAIGVGTREGELIPSGEDEGPFLKDRQGRVVKTSLQETPLQNLAAAGGGAYVRSAPGDFGVERLYQKHLSGLQRDELDSRMSRKYTERFFWFLAAAFLVLMLEAAGRALPIPDKGGRT